MRNYATHESTGSFCSWAGYWAGFNLMRNFDAGYTDHNTGRFCLHPRFLEPEFTTSSQSADDAQVGYCTLCLCCYTSVSFLCVMVHCCQIWLMHSYMRAHFQCELKADMQVEQGTAQDTESGNKRTKMPHEQATASNEASMSFLQDTAGHSLLVAVKAVEYDRLFT